MPQPPIQYRFWSHAILRLCIYQAKLPPAHFSSISLLARSWPFNFIDSDVLCSLKFQAAVLILLPHPRQAALCYFSKYLVSPNALQCSWRSRVGHACLHSSGISMHQKQLEKVIGLPVSHFGLIAAVGSMACTAS